MNLHRDVRVFGGKRHIAIIKINYKMELLNEKEFVTKYGDINTKTWNNIKVYRGRQRDSDSFHIDVVIHNQSSVSYVDSEEFNFTIASGHYNVRSNWVHLDVIDDLFDELLASSLTNAGDYKYGELEHSLTIAIENRDLYINS